MAKTFGKSVQVQKWGAPTVISAKGTNSRLNRQPQFIRMADSNKQTDRLEISTRQTGVTKITINHPKNKNTKGSAFSLSSLISPVVVFPFVIAKFLFGGLIKLINKATSPFARQEEDLDETINELNDSLGYHWKPFNTNFENTSNQQFSVKPKVTSNPGTLVNSVKETLQSLNNDNFYLKNHTDDMINGLDDIYPINTEHHIFSEADIDIPRIEMPRTEVPTPVIQITSTQNSEAYTKRLAIYEEALNPTRPPRVKKVQKPYDGKFDFSEMPQVKSKIETINKSAKKVLAKEAGMVPISEMFDVFTRAVQQKNAVTTTLTTKISPISKKSYASAPKMIKYQSQYPGVDYAAGIDEDNSSIVDSLAQSNRMLSNNIDSIVNQYFAKG